MAPYALGFKENDPPAGTVDINISLPSQFTSSHHTSTEQPLLFVKFTVCLHHPD